MGAVICLIVIPAVRIYFLVVSIGDYLADVRLLFLYEFMNFFFVHGTASHFQILLQKHKRIKNGFQVFFAFFLELFPFSGNTIFLV